MKYLHGSFSVLAPGTEDYARRWERTFRAGPDGGDTLPAVPSIKSPKVTCARCNVTFADFDGYRRHECLPTVPAGAH